MVKVGDIVAAILEYMPEADVEQVKAAYGFVQTHHHGQTRASGEPYISHVAEVALLATKLRLDLASIVTALLHDAVEDTDVTLDDIEAGFGEEVSCLVDGVTKISRVNFSSKAEQQSENFRKMLLAMATDIRVLLIKLCDRTHNMRTLEFLSSARRQRIAQETIDIYAPLAHRLGIYWIKSELEDLSFRHLKPEIFEKIKSHVNTKKKERERYISEVVNLLKAELAQTEVKAEVSGRPKHFFSIYQKMERLGVHFEEIYDLIAFRILVDSTMDCYSALGVVHAAWKPIPGRFKDYIAMPKSNGYQSLHTTVIGPKGARIEVQIRSSQMHDIAEKGIASHWLYKDDKKGGKKQVKDTSTFTWLRDLIESEKSHEDPLQFMSVVKDDLFPQEVFVFTPKGDLIDLPQGSTPIDFAYNIHSDIGDHCMGAKVNGQQVSLNYQLKNGDTVEVASSKSHKPSKDWLRFVATSKAKQRIRAWIRQQEVERTRTVGKELLTKELRKAKISFSKALKSGQLEEAAKKIGQPNIEAMIGEIGYGNLSTEAVVEKLVPEGKEIDGKIVERESPIRKIFQKAAEAFGDTASVKVDGLSDVVFRFARCCDPLPGDDIVGYVTRGRGVTVHRGDCSQILSFDNRRVITVTWDSKVRSTRRIKLKILSLDQVGILASLSQAISSCGANISQAHAAATPDGKAVNTFEVNIESASQLTSVTKALEMLDGVLRVERARMGTEEEEPVEA